nr:hypothetical protein [Streptomyces sp. S1D4-11]
MRRPRCWRNPAPNTPTSPAAPPTARFCAAAVRALVLGDFTAQTPSDRWQAAYAAALILARRDAGILDPDETQPLEHTVTSILGKDLLETLAQIWTAAHTTADEDGQAMLEHARAWCQALGAAPDQPEPAPDPRAGRPGELAEAIGAVAATVTANEAGHRAAQARVDAARSARSRAKADRAAQQRQAEKTAEKVFAPGARPFTPRASGAGAAGPPHR